MKKNLTVFVVILCCFSLFLVGCSKSNAINQTDKESLKMFKDRLAASKDLRQTAENLKSFFPIGVLYWTMGPEEEEAARLGINMPLSDREALEDIKAHTCNTIQVWNCSTEKRRQILEMAEEIGLKVLTFEHKFHSAVIDANEPLTEEELTPLVKEYIESISGYKSLLGYNICDEPSIAQSANAGVLSRVFEKLDPHHAAIPIHFISGGHRGPLLERQNKIGSLAFVFDNYKQLMSFNNNDPFYAAMSYGVDEAYEAAEAYDIPLWVVLSVFLEKGTPERQARSLRARMYVSLAHGAKGILYWPFQSVEAPPNLDDEYAGMTVFQGLLNLDGTPSPAWDEFKIVAKELEKLAPIILKLKRVANITDARLPIDAQTLRHIDGTTYVIVTNLNLDKDKEQKATIRIDKGTKFSSATDVLSGKDFPIVDGILTIPMSPGAGFVLKMK
jgi:hypothetical protein